LWHWDARTFHGQKEFGMVGVFVTFDFHGDFDRSRVEKVAERARGTFEGMPGLRFKFFTVDDNRQRAVNFYVWGSREQAESFFSPEVRDRVTGLYGTKPTVDFVEIAQVVDNTGERFLKS
jgi:hypothetical protein